MKAAVRPVQSEKAFNEERIMKRRYQRWVFRLGWLGAVAAAGVAGYGTRALYDPPVYNLKETQTAGLDYFFSPRSFSEVENAKAMLEAVCTRFTTEIRSQLYRCGLIACAAPDRSDELRERRLAAAIRTLEEGIEQFQGTGQEMVLTQDLLVVLKAQKLFDQWIHVYLNAVYRHPTDPSVARWTSEALTIGRAAGREGEILEALRHVAAIPLEFEVKHQIESQLAKEVPGNHFVQNEPVVHLSHR